MLKDAQGAAPAPAGGVEAVAPKPAPPGRGHNHPHIEFKFFAELKHRNVVRVDRSCMPRIPVRVGIDRNAATFSASVRHNKCDVLRQFEGRPFLIAHPPIGRA